jgi:hypothetical protein
MISSRRLSSKTPSLKLLHLVLDGFFGLSPQFKVYDSATNVGEKDTTDEKLVI